MLVLAALLVAVTSNLDNLAVGFSYGLRSLPVSLSSNAVIAGVTLVATWLSVDLGRLARHVLPGNALGLLGGGVLILIGGLTLRGAQVEGRPGAGGRAAPSRRALTLLLHPEARSSSRLGPGEALLLGLALSCNNLVLGAGAGVVGASSLLTALLSCAVSLLCVGGGSRAGLAAQRRLGGAVPSALAGLFLVLVGCLVAAR